MIAAHEQWRFWDKVMIQGQDNCWLWMAATNPKGYGQFSVNRIMEQAHRVSYAIEHPTEDIKGWDICHKCDVRDCVNPSHLFKATHAANIADAVAKGKYALGEKSHMAKLTLDDVNIIKSWFAEGGINKKELAALFKVDPSVVSRIISGDGWCQALAKETVCQVE